MEIVTNVRDCSLNDLFSFVSDCDILPIYGSIINVGVPTDRA